MTERLEVYKCEVCGNIVTVLHTGAGQLVCCKQPMVLYKENTKDAAREKHVPVISRTGDSVTVKVGSVPHPMEEKHYIEWIEIIVDGNKSYRQFLQPGQAPEATFEVKAEQMIARLQDGQVDYIVNPSLELKADQIIARAYCNLHGLWKS